METLTLKKAITVKKKVGEEVQEQAITELSFDWDRVNGYALIRCEKNARKENPGIMVLMLDQTYQAYVAAVATGLQVDDIFSLSGSDFQAALMVVLNFLTSSTVS